MSATRGRESILSAGEDEHAATGSGRDVGRRLNRQTTRMRDVADRAGVALSTVSAFINETAPVGRATSQRIREAIDALDYSPNPVARSLARGALDPEDIFLVIRSDTNGSTFAEAYRSESDAHAAAAIRGGERVELVTVRLK